MIELTPDQAILLYLGFTLSVILGFWLLHHIKRRQVMTQETKLCTCEYCHFKYLDQQLKSVTQCPQCGSYNKSSSD